MSWTEAQHAALELALKEGCTFSQAAAVVNDLFKTSYSRNAVIGRAGRKGLSQPHRKASAVVRKPVERRAAKTVSRMPVVARQPPEPIAERTADVVPRHISIYELTDSTCRWPFGNDGPPFTYCGCQTFDGPWCEPHDTLSKSSGTRGEQMATRISTGAKHG